MKRAAIVLFVLFAHARPPAAGAGDSLPDLILRVKPAVVTLLAYAPSKAMPGIGTGFFVAPDRVVTARHILAGAERAEVRTTRGDTYRVRGLIAEDLPGDCALIAVDSQGADIRPLAIAAAPAEEGEAVFTISSPFGLEWSVSQGIVSAVREIPGAGRALQHTAPISPGSSGCPLLNLRGEVVGVQSSTITTSDRMVQAGQNLNFAVPADRIRGLRVGELRTLAAAAKEVPAAWKPPLATGVDLAGLRFLTRDDFRAALPFFTEATAREPEDADAWFRLAFCHERTGSPDQAAECYRKAVALRPDFAVAHNNLGVVYIRQGRNALAVECLRKAVELDPDYTSAYTSLAAAYLNLNRFAEAAEASRRATRGG